MSVLVGNPFFLGAGASAGGGGYQIERSLRFNTPDNSFLSRTPASTGNKKTWTWAGWVKRSRPTFDTDYLIGCYFGGSLRYEYLAFTPSDSLDWFSGLYTTGGSTTTSGRRITTAVYRDTSAWYHIVLAKDTTQATAANRVKLYVNGVEVTTFSTSTDPAQNDESFINATDPHRIGSLVTTTGFYGYLADVHFIDGQALTPSDFTEVSATTGQLIPKEYTGTFGTNGFWLKFSDNSAATATTLGKDYSGNSNNWTPNNLSVTAGAGNDSLTDTPTSYGTGSSGGDVRGNFCTWNPLDVSNASNLSTFSNGNLDCVIATLNSSIICGTMSVTSGKWYWEITYVDNGGFGASYAFFTGVGDYDLPILQRRYAGGAGGWVYYASDGSKWNNGTSSAYGNSWQIGDTIGVALDMDNGTLTFYKNGTSQGTAFSSGLTGKRLGPTAMNGTGSTTQSVTANFGQRPFLYSPPANHKPLVDTYFAAPVVAKPSTVMDVKLYTGNGSTQTISGLGFSPDFVWIKERSSTSSHQLYDTIRGATKTLYSNSSNEEQTNANALTSFTSTGFNVGVDNNVNQDTQTYVAWTWDAGSSTAPNTSGSISSQVRVNTSAGFSIVTYTGTGANATVGHGLGVAPQLVIVKRRDVGADWTVYHISGGNGNALFLNSTASLDAAPSYWNSTSPTSTTFSIGTNGGVNISTGTYVAYCFAPVAGYSSAFSFTGNGSSDGPMVWLGFKPRFLFIKRTDSTSFWHLYDTARNTYNVTNSNLWANGSDAEITNSAYDIDILSNGFKLRTSDAARNASGGTYVGFAWAENPFQYARAR